MGSGQGEVDVRTLLWQVMLGGEKEFLPVLLKTMDIEQIPSFLGGWVGLLLVMVTL